MKLGIKIDISNHYCRYCIIILFVLIICKKRKLVDLPAKCLVSQATPLRDYEMLMQTWPASLLSRASQFHITSFVCVHNNKHII